MFKFELTIKSFAFSSLTCLTYCITVFENKYLNNRENRIQKYKSIIDKVSTLEFDKIDYPRNVEHNAPGYSDASNASSSFQRLKQKYLNQTPQ